MTMRDVGDQVDVRYEARDPDGTLTTATVALTVTDPSGTTSTPTVSSTSTGIYDADFALSAAGLWTWQWDVTGAVVDVAHGSVFAQDPAPALYAGVAELKRRIGVSDGTDDDRFLAALSLSSREIDHHCGRRFWPSTTATARVFRPPRRTLARIDDFWTTTDLVVETDDSDTGTYSTTWASTDYELEPFNGVVDGEPGWPYWRIRAVGTRYFPCTRRAGLRVTAKWGWANVPDPVREACLILAEEAAKLAESPFGVGGYSQFGIVRVRDNPMAARMLMPYRRDPMLVA